MKNKYQKALDNVIETYQELERRVGNNPDKVKDFDDITTLQELVDKETPMKVNQDDYMICENVDGDYDYFPMVIHYYSCPNKKCKLHERYELCFDEKRCPECNQLLDWGGKKNEKNK